MAMQFDLGGIGSEQLARLMETLAKSDVEECEIEQGDCKLSLRRVPRADIASREHTTDSPASDTATPEEQRAIMAPAVGVFFRSEKRPGPPKVEVGSRIKVGDVVGYIQVMNIPHSVHSTREGVVEGFLVEDGQPVEYGQPLVSIQPSAEG